jgi:hypothetical protein
MVLYIQYSDAARPLCRFLSPLSQFTVAQLYSARGALNKPTIAVIIAVTIGLFHRACCARSRRSRLRKLLLSPVASYQPNGARTRCSVWHRRQTKSITSRHNSQQRCTIMTKQSYRGGVASPGSAVRSAFPVQPAGINKGKLSCWTVRASTSAMPSARTCAHSVAGGH